MKVSKANLDGWWCPFSLMLSRATQTLRAQLAPKPLQTPHSSTSPSSQETPDDGKAATPLMRNSSRDGNSEGSNQHDVVKRQNGHRAACSRKEKTHSAPPPLIIAVLHCHLLSLSVSVCLSLSPPPPLSRTYASSSSLSRPRNPPPHPSDHLGRREVPWCSSACQCRRKARCRRIPHWRPAAKQGGHIQSLEHQTKTKQTTVAMQPSCAAAPPGQTGSSRRGGPGSR